MDDYMEIAQRNHDEAEQHHREFMHHAAEQHRQHQHRQHQHAQDVVTDEEMDKLEKEFQEWMTYIKNKKL